MKRLLEPFEGVTGCIVDVLRRAALQGVAHKSPALAVLLENTAFEMLTHAALAC
jgi:hypothetical protein